MIILISLSFLYNYSYCYQATFGISDDPLRCRYYENQFPEPEEIVMCNVTEIGEIAVYVTLLEYDNIKV